MRRVIVATVVVLALVAPVLAQETPERPRAKEAVKEFLLLTEAQVGQWDALLAAREAAVAPLREQLGSVEQQLKELLGGPNPDAGAVGALVISGRNLRAGIEEANHTYVQGFEALLSYEQKGRLVAMRRAARVEPLIPAFQVFGLVPR